MNLNGKTTNPGELRTKIRLAPRTVSVETGGFRRPAPDIANAVDAWARWTNAHGAEVWQAQAAQAEQTATILTRYLVGIDPTWYISKDGGVSWYDIVSIDDIGERHAYLEIKVKLWKEG